MKVAMQYAMSKLTGGSSGSGSSNGTTTTCVQDPSVQYGGYAQYPQGSTSNGTYCPAGTVPQTYSTGSTSSSSSSSSSDEEDDSSLTDANGELVCDSVKATKSETTSSTITLGKEEGVIAEKVTTVESCKNTNRHVTTVTTYTFKDGTTKTKETDEVKAKATK
jgi:hypothetical protein